MLIVRNLIFFFLALVLTAAVFLYGDRFLSAPRIVEIPKEAPLAPPKVIPLNVIKREIISPPPLRVEKEAPTALLTRSGIISLTNVNRAANNLVPLRENIKLNSAAELKVKDMFSKQYFAHVSPQGDDAGDLTEKVSYQFLRIGENLASGNFTNDQELIQGWMDSPGHRANILNTAYEEIGVAAERGIFESKSVWLAVQIFGLPRSACPSPNEELKLKIEAHDKEIEELRVELDALRAEIEGMQNLPPKRYNELVESYNALVERYNKLAEETKILVGAYNAGVEATNQCIDAKTKN